MKVNEIVWVEHDAKIKKCLLSQVCPHEDRKDTYILKVIGSEETLIGDKHDLFKTKEECEVAFRKRYDKKYNAYYSEFQTLEELLAYLLHATMTRKCCDDIEMAAAVNRASEFTGIDMLVTPRRVWRGGKPALAMGGLSEVLAGSPSSCPFSPGREQYVPTSLFSSIQLLSRVRLFATLWTAARQAASPAP